MIYDILPVNNYQGNNGSNTFDFNFYIDNKEQLKVYHYDENNIKSELVLDVDYSINEIKNKNGSYITFPIDGSSYSILGENQKLSLELSLPVSQETQYNNSSLLNLEALEYSFDYLTRLIQIIARKLSLCLKVEECSNSSPDVLLDDINKKAALVAQYADDVSSNYASLVSVANIIKQDYDKFQKIDLMEDELNNVNLALSSKADVSFSNITQDAKSSVLSSIGISDYYVDYEMGALTVYNFITAPANGWFVISKYATSANQRLEVCVSRGDVEDYELDGLSQSVYATNTGNRITVSIYCASGDKIAYNTSLGGATYKIRFYYAKGEL